MDLDAWIRQPTTLHGLAVAAAGVGVALAHVATGNPTIDGICAVIAYVGVHLGIDDHSAGEAAVTAFVNDLTHPGTVTPAKLLGDASGAAGVLTPPAQ